MRTSDLDPNTGAKSSRSHSPDRGLGLFLVKPKGDTNTKGQSSGATKFHSQPHGVCRVGTTPCV